MQPPGGHEAVPAVQTNTGDHPALVFDKHLKNHYKLLKSFILHLIVFSSNRRSFRLRFPGPCSPAQLGRLGGFHICRFQVRFSASFSCVNTSHPFFIYGSVFEVCSLSLIFHHLSSTAPVKMLSNQDGCSLVEL